ncbi:MAG: peptidase U32 family protein [Promethearchaeota archaeon]
MQKKCELLVPSQNFKSLDAIIQNNLKSEYVELATYFGVEIFNMRMHAKNIRLNSLPEFVKKCHQNNINAYLTSNIIVYENELDMLRTLIENAYKYEVDAIIAHDFATIKMAKEIGIPFHISTQASVSNSMATLFYEEIGAERIILAREVSLAQIAEITPKLKKAKIEAFVHGAMCTSISGRCYFSQTICESAEFSANRGKCLQPCRNRWRVIYLGSSASNSPDKKNLVDNTSDYNSYNHKSINNINNSHSEKFPKFEFDYDGFYFINAKDLCMIEYLPEMLQAGIYGFKIEGRMRSAYYIDITSQIYFNALHECFIGDYSKEKAKRWKKKLGEVYNRGFSTGFYFSKPTGKDINRLSTGNQATKRKIQLGQVIAFYRDKHVAKIELINGKLAIGDEIIIEGSEKGPYCRIKLNSIYHKNKLIHETPKLSKENENAGDISNLQKMKKKYLITVKLPENCIVKKGNRVFKYININTSTI